MSKVLRFIPLWDWIINQSSDRNSSSIIKSLSVLHPLAESEVLFFIIILQRCAVLRCSPTMQTKSQQTYRKMNMLKLKLRKLSSRNCNVEFMLNFEWLCIQFLNLKEERRKTLNFNAWTIKGETWWKIWQCDSHSQVFQVFIFAFVRVNLLPTTEIYIFLLQYFLYVISLEIWELKL